MLSKLRPVAPVASRCVSVGMADMFGPVVSSLALLPSSMALLPPSMALAVRTVSTTPPSASAQVEVPDPMDVFDKIDANGDGSLSREEFQNACELLSLDQLVALSESVSRSELSAGISPDSDMSYGSVLFARVKQTLDVTLSKIVPAGFGWQMASVYADSLGYEADAAEFFAITGAGDMAGVWIGHTTFSALKKAAGVDINLKSEVQTGLLLGSAAFCSGFTWQPAVNGFVAMGCGFNAAALGTGVACGLAFFGGLRVFRNIFGLFMDGVEAPTYSNLKADAALSLSIGGATGAFVGTDVSFADNWLRPVVGIEEGVPDLVGGLTAGSSTALGFTVSQMAQNIVTPKGKCWVD